MGFGAGIQRPAAGAVDDLQEVIVERRACWSVTYGLRRPAGRISLPTKPQGWHSAGLVAASLGPRLADASKRGGGHHACMHACGIQLALSKL